MRMRYLAFGIGLLALVPLAGCATFCEEPGGGWPYEAEGRTAGIPEERVAYDGQGRRCVDVTIFDVVDALGDGDDSP